MAARKSNWQRLPAQGAAPSLQVPEIHTAAAYSRVASRLPGSVRRGASGRLGSFDHAPRTRRAFPVGHSPNKSIPAIEPLEPRKLLAAVRVMPLGDSITSSFDTDPGYRFWLYKQLKLDGYDVDFVGSQRGNHSEAAPDKQGVPPYRDFDQDHEGHAGFTAEQLLAQLPTYLRASTPDVVLLHAGTNDMLKSFSVDDTVARLGQMIDTLRAANPRVTVLLAQVIPARVLPENLAAPHARIPALASAKDTAQSRVIVVDQATGYSAATDNYDEYHPNLAGENKIAARFYPALVRVLPAPATPPAPVRWLTDLKAASATNGQGPVEVNFS